MSFLREDRRKAVLVSFALLLLVAAVYAQAGGFGALDFDDGEYVFGNPPVMAGVTPASIAWAFTTVHSANWHPLTWIAHMADADLFGARAGGHHLSNVALHAANAVALFFVLRLLTSAFWPSALVAALFAVHPQNVESVAWISQKKSVLSTLFLLGTIAAHAAWVRRGGVSRRALALALLALGLLAKPMLVSAPLLLLCLDVWPLRRWDPERPLASARPLLVEKLPYFAVAAAASAVTWWAQARWGATGSAEAFPLGVRVANALVAPVLYLRDAVWPAGLAFFYPHPAATGERVPLAAALLAGALLAAITAAAFLARRTRPWLLAGWAWYAAALLPVIGLVQVGAQARADRYAYVPMIGVFAAAVFSAARLVEEGRLPRAGAAAFGAAAVAALALAAHAQAATWRDGEALYGRALRVTERNWLAWNNLGVHHLVRGAGQPALAAFNEAARLKPDFADAHYNRGVVLLRSGRPDEAAAAFARSVEIDPENVDGLVNLGYARLHAGRFREALAAYEAALALRPGDAVALRGVALARGAALSAPPR